MKELRDVIISELKEARNDIKALHEEVHLLELQLSRFQVRIKAYITIISIIVAGGFNFAANYFKF